MKATKLAGIEAFYGHMEAFGFLVNFPDDAVVELALFWIRPIFDSKHIIFSW